MTNKNQKKPKARTSYALVRELAAIDPNHEALVDTLTNQRWSYQALVDDITRCAQSLLASGINPGDRVGILAGNRAEWIIAHFGISAIGAISVGLNTWSSAHELGYQLEHAAVKLLFVEARFKERDFLALVGEAHKNGNGLPSLRSIVALEDDPHSSVNVLPHNLEQVLAKSWHEFLTADNEITTETFEQITNNIKEDDVACLLYTSGSTALPKGVPLLHKGLIDNMWEIGERQHLVPTDRLWLAVSLFWSLASVNALFALLTHRATVVLQHHFDAGEALEIIAHEKCSVFYGTPNMALALSEHPNLTTADLGSLRTGVTIGTSSQVQRIADLGVEQICNVYGLTESYGNSCVSDASLPLAKRLETVGQVLPGQDIQIVNPETLAALSIGETGEIVLRGNVTQGYWQDPERTAESFIEGGWFRTGDYGFLDEQGYLYFRGRLKEMVKTGGINVAPAEVEEVLSTHESVELAFVTGIPDERLDEALAAVIVFKTGKQTEEASLIAHCRKTLASYKTPRHFRFVTSDQLPLTSTGKLQRSRLAELFSGD